MALDDLRTNETLWHYVKACITIYGFNDLYKEVCEHFDDIQIKVDATGEFVVTGSQGNTQYRITKLKLIEAFEIYKLIIDKNAGRELVE